MYDPVTWDYAIRFGLFTVLVVGLIVWAAEVWRRGRGP